MQVSIRSAGTPTVSRRSSPEVVSIETCMVVPHNKKLAGAPLGPRYLGAFLRRKCTANLVRKGGLEPPHIAALEPKSSVSTNSTTSAI